MKASSLSHLTAVSGANCAIVTAAAFALAAAAGIGRGIRIMVALLALVGFIVLVTPESSVVRAGAMAVVVLIALASGRPGGGIAALAVAVIVLLCVDPWYSRDYGFALSVCATAGLLLLAGPLAKAMARVMPTPLAIVLGVPLAAQLACQPVLILLDPALSLYGVPANLLAAPAAPVGTIAGLIGCLLLPMLPSVGFAFLQVAWVPASWIALVAHAAAALPFGRLPWIPDAAGAVLLVVCTALVLWLVLDRSPRPRLRAAAITVLLIAVAVPIGISVGAPTLGRALRPGSWTLAACDIGQGDAVLLRSGGATALIDTGPDPAALRRCLDFLAIDRIDLLVLTHWDADHAGGTLGRRRTGRHGRPRAARRRAVEPGTRPARRRGSPCRRGDRRRSGVPGRRTVAGALAQARCGAGKRRERRDRRRDARLPWHIPRRSRRRGAAPLCSRPRRSVPSTSSRSRTTARPIRAMNCMRSSTPPWASSASAQRTGTDIRPTACSTSSRERGPQRCAPTARERRCSLPATGGFSLWTERADERVGARP